MIKVIERLEKDKKIIFDQLDDFLKPFFFQTAREQYKKDYLIIDPEVPPEKVT